MDIKYYPAHLGRRLRFRFGRWGVVFELWRYTDTPSSMSVGTATWHFDLAGNPTVKFDGAADTLTKYSADPVGEPDD